MKKWTLGLLAAALCVAPATAGSFGVFVSNFAPDAADDATGVGFELRAGSGDVDFELRISIYEELETDRTVQRLSVEAVPVDFGFNYNFGSGSRVHPYVGGGGTYAVFDFDVDTTILDDQRTVDIDPEWGYYAQFGVDFELNDKSKIFLQGVYRVLEAEAEEDDLGLEVDQGLDMSGGAVNLGIAFTF